MRQKPKILLAMLAVFAGALLWIALRLPREPAYQGKRLSEWMDDLGNYGEHGREALAA